RLIAWFPYGKSAGHAARATTARPFTYQRSPALIVSTGKPPVKPAELTIVGSGPRSLGLQPPTSYGSVGPNHPRRVTPSWPEGRAVRTGPRSPRTQRVYGP